MSQWGDKDQLDNAPKFVVDAVTGDSGADNYGSTPKGTFGVDAQESVAARDDGKGSVPTGWVLREEGSGGRAGRVTHEVLVALSANAFGGVDDDITDAVDFVGADAANTGTADDTQFPDS